MDEFFYLLTPHFFHFCQFYAFLYFVHKISSMPKKISTSFSDRGDVLIKVVDFLFGYVDLEIFEFVIENTLKTP